MAVGVDVVAVTANPAIDQTVWIPGLRAGAVERLPAPAYPWDARPRAVLLHDAGSDAAT